MNTSDIRYLVNTLDPKGIPVVTPAGVLGGHLDAMKFCEHIPQEEYPAGALAAALYLCSGVRGMERGTVSSVRDENGSIQAASAYNVQQVPTLFLIDKNNVLQKRDVQIKNIDAEIKSLL